MRSWRGWLALLVCLLPLAPQVLLWMPDAQGQVATGSDLAGSGFDGSVLAASVLVAAAAAALALLIGASLAALLSLTDFPLPAVWATMALLPFICPPTVWTLGQMYCFGPGGVMERVLGDDWRPMLSRANTGHYLATIVVLAEVHVPLVMLIVGRGFERLHQAGFESARFYLSRRRWFAWMLTAARRELIGAYLLAFALGIGNFAVPHVLQCRLYVIEVYMRLTNYLDVAGAVRAAGMLLLVAMTAGLLAWCGEGGVRGSAADVSRRWRMPLGRARWPLLVLVAGYFAGTTWLPLAAIACECQSFALFFEAVREAAPETANSLRLGFGAVLLACGLGLLVATLVGRHARRSPVDAVVTATLGVPSLLIGLAMSRLAYRTWPVDLSILGASSLLVTIGLAARGWPFAARLLINGRRAAAPAWYEAATLGGLRGWRRWRWLDGPLFASDLGAAALLVFVLAIGEVEISQLLCPPGGGTLALRLFTYLHFGPTHVTASLAMLQLLLAVVPVFVYFVLANRVLRLV
ncbi:MAG: iron ABC transporter permease [Planctomycetales bacterium]|nr:iron ABC transporter permease [Planctomycetales bacterium]